MKTLWAPWRMEYIKGETERAEGCLFDVAAGIGDDRARLLLSADPLVVVFLNRFPYANGHLLVAPRRHLGEIGALNGAENCALMTMLQASVAILRRHLQPAGFNIGLNLGATAGAGLADHLHFHIVPRWEGDHNFMTVLAEVRVIPEHLERTWDRLIPDFRALPGQLNSPLAT